MGTDFEGMAVLDLKQEQEIMDQKKQIVWLILEDE
jgi:hypothetical protein